ncbi:aldehyde dehydrogenase [Paraburkholderia silvatlantica]|uniref:Gamma-glutamyl-gamma-aminobutyraldehyde dehydrogenase n=1 Tax=Paraburkholderia silvatlantica TaxID=321895 RepID=A0ABR6FNW0_9BURK|nr:aldehyde dehydrogenase [Paraburkholderia silvatlantica]MBB2928723.1 gamma-glutamyl-gamma-aminobutyraldehyde dehydrogenase [Paraburkholderia silvatlantica]PVY35306.1 gamma-glutamyl-gamma-aminobutyraldehyde dehydrogenase [Paraburkholderia silvatlantica]PXW40948.1 gamma-glutamyl-gamma-aminobutyraldehyde dehydrogenase [Paraburkholderia silvatlantica]TDQ98225.1 gamma-glutamyl-gamma-aminobutyraldehyde dehydrogenase [Paraburkholderia silvatlantica]
MEKKTFTYWQDKAATLSIEGRAFIDGAYRDAYSGRTFDCVSPIDGRVLASVADCGAADVDAAVGAARRAFDEGVWAGLNPRARKAVLLRWAALMREHLDELALLETLDAGKPIGDTTTVDVPGAAYCVEWFAEAVDKVGGEVVPADHHLVGLVTREPIGVVAAVVPWNFPILMASWKFGPALAAGNSVVLKPSEKSPLTAIRVAQLAHEAGIPAGVFNVLPGGGEPGKLLGLHRDVDCIAFTGSTNVGKQIMQYAGQSNLKRVWLELGGKSPNIVLHDCPDLDRAASAAASAIFYNMGEMCTAGSRLLVHHEIKDVFLAKLVEAAKAYKPGNPLDPEVSMGAIIDKIQLERVLSYIEAGRKDSKLLTGGERVNAEGGGFYVEPTVFDTRHDTKIAREEIFGPVLSVITFSTIDEAVRIANDSDYGLAAAVWTANLTHAHEISRRLRAGTVWVNCYDEGGDMNFPFGGFKESGNGRDKSLHALEKYTELKSTLVRLR